LLLPKLGQLLIPTQLWFVILGVVPSQEVTTAISPTEVGERAIESKAGWEERWEKWWEEWWEEWRKERREERWKERWEERWEEWREEWREIRWEEWRKERREEWWEEWWKERWEEWREERREERWKERREIRWEIWRKEWAMNSVINSRTQGGNGSIGYCIFYFIKISRIGGRLSGYATNGKASVGDRSIGCSFVCSEQL